MVQPIESLSAAVPPTMYAVEEAAETTQFGLVVMHSQKHALIYGYKLADTRYVFPTGNSTELGANVENCVPFLDGDFMLIGTVHSSLSLSGLMRGVQYTRGVQCREAYVLTDIQENKAVAVPVKAVIDDPSLMPDNMRQTLRQYPREKIISFTFDMLGQGFGYWGFPDLKTLADQGPPVTDSKPS